MPSMILLRSYKPGEPEPYVERLIQNGAPYEVDSLWTGEPEGCWNSAMYTPQHYGPDSRCEMFVSPGGRLEICAVDA